MPEPQPFPDAIPDEVVDELGDATARLVRTVDGAADDAWAAPSLLPGWTRAHLLAHLALNAEALAGVLHGVVRGEEVAMYPSPLHRDTAIAELARAEPEVLRERLLSTSAVLADALAAVPSDRWQQGFRRTPDTAEHPLSGVPEMRLREVEVHHVDLGLGATPADWPRSFPARLVGYMVERRPTDRPLRVHATDLGRTWETPEPADATVHGTAADLGWWLTGRGTGEGLWTDDDGELPRIEEL
ncbi:maleylpyruvate isomerase family mycothiol-dependent enzyme [Nocardioides sp. SYSU DS0663]|uniref:maleylpyruvate isomerase family mycothiol-dependent enzyme n=1 Tax=Nocardioides sp. SYSU DS0663 TaxID=3416445 RepID=UPI003F4C790D